MQNVIAIVETSWKSGDWDAVSGKVFYYVGLLLVFYILSILSAVTYTQMMAGITQGFLKKLRVKMFNGMQDLPVRYFDTHNHGDIMSYYTNDIDTLRQMVSQSIPQLLISSITVLTVFSIMPVSYTHLDVYKRQEDQLPLYGSIQFWAWRFDNACYGCCFDRRSAVYGSGNSGGD